MKKKIVLLFSALLFILIFALTFNIAHAASLSLSPSSGKVNTQFTISGSSFTSGLAGTAIWDDGSILSSGLIDGSGNFSGTGTVPTNATTGAHTVSLSASSPAMNKPWWQFIIPRALAFVPSDYATATYTVTQDTPTPSPSTTSSDTPTSTSTTTSTASSDSSAATASSSSGSTSQETATSTENASQLDKNKSKISVNKTECLADGKDKITINLSLMDSQGKVITGLKPEVIVSGSNNSISKIGHCLIFE